VSENLHWKSGKTDESLYYNKGIELIFDLLTNWLKLTSCGSCGWDGSLVLSPLQSITRQDLANTPEAVFNSINGLRDM